MNRQRSSLVFAGPQVWATCVQLEFTSGSHPSHQAPWSGFWSEGHGPNLLEQERYLETLLKRTRIQGGCLHRHEQGGARRFSGRSVWGALQGFLFKSPSKTKMPWKSVLSHRNPLALWGTGPGGHHSRNTLVEVRSKCLAVHDSGDPNFSVHGAHWPFLKVGDMGTLRGGKEHL